MNNDQITQENYKHSLKVCFEQSGQRIDVFLSEQLPMFSRTIIKKLLHNKQVIINDTHQAKPSYVIKHNDIITLLSIPMPITRSAKEIPDNIGVTIIAEHSDFIIINKPAGLVVHPPQETYQDVALTDWLIKRYPTITSVGESERPGIVHRLDRNTSGIMIIALTSAAHATLSAMFKNRKIQKTYTALVVGHTPAAGSIDYVISRHPVKKNMMHSYPGISESNQARDALTDYKTIEYFDTFSVVEVKPKTGRTHQIRVHFKAIGHPLLGDSIYGSTSKKIGYHALHAQSLEFVYNEKHYAFTSPLDPKLQSVLSTSTLAEKNHIL